MALNRIFDGLYKSLKDNITTANNLKILNWKNFIYLFSIIVFCAIFVIISNVINKKNRVENENLTSIVESDEFSNLNKYFFSKINNPYKEIKYLIKNNDSVEKILKKLDVSANDIKIISNKLKQKKLTNIYAGRELSLVLKN